MKRYGITMKEKIIHIEVSKRKEKKYMVIVKDLTTKKKEKYILVLEITNNLKILLN